MCRFSANITARFAWQDGHTPRRLHENAIIHATSTVITAQIPDCPSGANVNVRVDNAVDFAELKQSLHGTPAHLLASWKMLASGLGQ